MPVSAVDRPLLPTAITDRRPDRTFSPVDKAYRLMPACAKMRLLRRLWLAYHRTQDRVLIRRGQPFFGTPARCFEDIRTYMTHAAVCRLEGLPPPEALGRPGIAGHAWFAGRRSAEAIADRHAGYAGGALFEAIMTDFPVVAVLKPEHRVAAGHLKAADAPGLAYDIHAMAATVVSRNPGACGNPHPAGRNASAVVEHRLFALVRLAGEIIGAAVFQRAPGSDLYRLALIGMREGSHGRANRQQRRLAHRAFLRFNDAIGLWPGVFFDFIGAAEPAAAAMGYSLFRRWRGWEMARLKALDPAGYHAERRRVTAYRYPVFPHQAVVSRAQTLAAMLWEAPLWAMHWCRRAHRQAVRPKGRTP